MSQITVTDPAESQRIVYTNERSKFRRLVMRGVLLELVTVGFYRFWLATDMRRHLWSRTSVNGDAAEYTGTGKELLLGFLFALAILTPIYLTYFLIGIEVESWKAFASAPLFLFFYLFSQFAIYRARRYRLTRTVWRGVRFWMTGFGWSYAWRASLWSLFVVVTLGLALPWRQAALERFKMRHTSYGDLQGRFEGTGWELFKRSWWLLILGSLIIVATVVAVGIMEYFAVQVVEATAADDKAATGPVVDTLGIAALSVFLISLLLYVTYPFIHAAYKGVEWRWWLSGIRFGNVSFSSDIKRGALIGLYWKMTGWATLIIGVFTGLVVVGIILSSADIEGMSRQEFKLALWHDPSFLTAFVVGYIIMALALGVIIRIYLMHDLWKRVTESVSVHNLSTADNVAVKGKLASALGEGLADGLDVAGF